MKFALVNEQPQEAQPNLSGKCKACGHTMVAKCGEVRIWHWAHKSHRHCDSWWENETEWHRAWKGQFPVSWQEVIHQAENGEKHIADVKTDQGWVIEFQHSYIKPGERRSRDAFYQKIVWVVDGTRRKRDRAQFVNVLNESTPGGRDPQIRRAFSGKCALPREWADSHAPVFFDFGEKALWWLLSKIPNGPVYVAPFSRTDFIQIHRGGASQMARDFEEFAKDITKSVADYEAYLQAQAQKRARQQFLQGYPQIFTRRKKPRRRL